MKKLIILSLSFVLSGLLFAQNPNHPPQRPLHNQFRDYVEFRQQQEKPKIERKDGNVIITMTEEQFNRMQMMRKQSHMMTTNFRPTPPCRMCQMKHKRHLPGRRI